jgi:HEAT repeat protein
MNPSAKFWLSQLNDGIESVRDGARRALCSLTPDDREDVPDLIEALDGSDPVLGYWAARGLSGIGPAALEALPALTTALSAKDSDVRFWAVTALSSVGPPARSAIPRLTEMLDDPVFGVRQAVTGALVRIAPTDDAVSAALVGTLRTDGNEGVREEAVGALGRAGTPSAVNALADALADHNLGVRRYAAIGLKMLGSRAGAAIDRVRRALASAPDESVRIQLEVALSRMEGTAEPVAAPDPAGT